jgi:hypothetical protein
MPSLTSPPDHAELVKASPPRAKLIDSRPLETVADRPSDPTAGDGRVRFRRSLELCARLPEQPTGDDELLDLLRPFEDVHDLAAS